MSERLFKALLLAFMSGMSLAFAAEGQRHWPIYVAQAIGMGALAFVNAKRSTTQP